MSQSYIEALEHRRLMASGSILFIRGADRSGGFLEATNDTQRTEQLADINNNSTAAGNHGWGQLAALLRGEGYDVFQQTERLEHGAPATGQTIGYALAEFDMDFSQYDAVVMASNNAVYRRREVDALDAYVKNGGGVLFISDANFGSSWADAPSSDNAFLGRYGLAFNQDNGQYALRRDVGDFAVADEPVLIGVNTFDGEGVSPVRVGVAALSTDSVRRVVGARGTTYDNNPTSTANNSRGMARPVDGNDAALVLANSGAGRVAAFFDRNTFFNANGAGTDLTKNDNTQLAKNLFNWVTDSSPPAIVSSSFSQSPSVLRFRLDDNIRSTLTRDDIRIRNRRTGANIAGPDWALTLTEGNGYTDVTVRIRAGVTSGAYQFRVPRNQVTDDSGNTRAGAIRYAFTILPASNTASAASLRTAKLSAGAAFDGWSDTPIADDVLA